MLQSLHQSQFCNIINYTTNCYSLFSPNGKQIQTNNYTVNQKKIWHYIFEYNFEKSQSIFIIFALLYTGRNFLHMYEECPHLNIVLTVSCENEASHFILL